MKLKIFTRVRLEKCTFIWYTSLKNSTASKQLHCCPLTNELKNATWKSLLVNMFQAAKKIISHVCKRDEPSRSLRSPQNLLNKNIIYERLEAFFSRLQDATYSRPKKKISSLLQQPILLLFYVAKVCISSELFDDILFLQVPQVLLEW